jgi:hypothetical protein
MHIVSFFDLDLAKSFSMRQSGCAAQQLAKSNEANIEAVR